MFLKFSQVHKLLFSCLSFLSTCKFPPITSSHALATSSVCLCQPDALNITLLINTETKREAKRQPESECKAPVTVIKMSEGQGRHGDWDKGVGGEQEGDTLCAICVHVYVCLSCGE